MTISNEDLTDLRYAKFLLENPSLAARITDRIGSPIEKGFERLPEKWANRINQIARSSLEKALNLAVSTLDRRNDRISEDRAHRMLVAATGGAGGAFGLLALSVELPVSTSIMLRSIADIARSEGERITDPEVKLACLEVFALGGGSTDDDAAETGYFAVRAMLARAVSEAARHIAEKGLTRESAPVLVRFISQVASRFGVIVSEKAAAQAVPVIGAASGALINTVFMKHFQDIARGHFIVRRLERTYGTELVQAEYEKI